MPGRAFRRAPLLLLWLPIAAAAALSCKNPSPPSGCIYLDSHHCSSWPGCYWRPSVQACEQKPNCRPDYRCPTLGLLHDFSSARLPACVRRDATNCQVSRQAVFDALRLSARCDFAMKPMNLNDTALASLAAGAAKRPGAGHASKAPTARGTRSPAARTGQGAVFVSPQGSDGNPGTRDSPLLSVRKAVTATHARRPRVVVLLAGTHRLDSTLELTPEDSNVTIQGEAGAVMSGALQLQGLAWSGPDALGVVHAAIPSSAAGKLDVLSALFVDGQPAIRARYPNQPDFLSSRFSSEPVDKWFPGPTPARAKSVFDVPINPTNFRYGFFSSATGAGCQGVFSPPSGYFCAPQAEADGACAFSLPQAVQLSAATSANLRLASWATRATGYLHTFQSRLWGQWTFALTDAGAPNGPLFLGSGGFQEARGDCGKGGRSWFVENVRELLDAPNEFFYSPASPANKQQAELYFKPNGTLSPNASNPSVMEMTMLRTLIRLQGTAASPVVGVRLSGLTFRHTYAAHMDPHEMPSGGDWSVNRLGAVVLEGVANVSVTDSYFSYLGGHGVVVSRFARNVSIERNEFFALAASGVVVLGESRLAMSTPWDMTKDANHPEFTTVCHNWATHVGLVVKQSAFAFMSLCKGTLVSDNVVYNGPRSGIVFNDGFGGDNQVVGNALFLLVAETADQGPIKAWSRQSWLESPGGGGGKPPNQIRRNFILGTENSTASAVNGNPIPGATLGVDLDDGAENFVVADNIILWASLKFKGDTVITQRNLILFPQLSGFDGRGCFFISSVNFKPAHFAAMDSICVSQNEAYSFSNSWYDANIPCTPGNWNSDRNLLFSAFFNTCRGKTQPFAGWQIATGLDLNTTWISGTPDSTLIQSWVQSRVNLAQGAEANYAANG